MIFDLTGDVSSEDEFLSLPPLKKPSKKPSKARWKEISKTLKEFKNTRNS